MPHRRKLLYLAAVGGVGGFLVYTLFYGRLLTGTAESPQLFGASAQTQQNAEARQNISALALTASSLVRQIIPHYQWEPDRIAQIEAALRSKDEAAIKAVVANIGNCPHCLEHIAAFLDDPFQDVAGKIVLSRLLMQSGTQAETLLLVNAIVSAHLGGKNDLKDGLLQALADAQTQESAAALITVITDGSAGLEFRRLPEELQHAIKKSIRLNPNGEATGQMLAENYNSQVSSEIAQNIEDVKQPIMVSLLAKEAHQVGEIARVEHLVHLLSTMDDPRTLDGLMLLGENNVMPLDETNERAYAWVSEHDDSFDQDHYAAYLSDFDANAVQRSVAAFALAAAQDSKRARAAVEKALYQESDPRVRSHLKSALHLLSDHSNP